jgi:hypothetical protein
MRSVKPSRDTVLLLGIAAAKAALNFAFLGRYGYFRDELYYIACSDHLAWGYVDHPPLSIFLLAAARWVLGDSLPAIRILAVLAGAATVVLTGLTARKLGGGRFSQLLAATAAAASPVVLGNAGRFFSMNAFDLLLWAWGAYLLVAILVEGRETLWLAFGLVAGLGLMNKYSMLFLGLGAVAGLLATARRRDLLRPWIWLGGAIAVAIVLPHAVWEIRHGFPSAEFIRNASVEKNAPLSVADFLASQPGMTGFGQALLVLLGLGYFWVRGREHSLRLFAWMLPVVAVAMMLGNAKAYYLTPVYAPYVAAGAIAVERIATRPRLSWSKHAVTAGLLLFALVALPFAVPVLPVDDFIRYQAALGHRPKAEERSRLEDLPQYYADMFGWEEMVAQVASIYRRLTPDEQRHCVIFARNYGEAAAIDFFGERYGLPRAVCPHNNYWYWGTGVEPMRVAIVFGHHGGLEENLADLRGPGRFESVELAATTSCEHCMPFENHRPIFLCRGPRFTLREIWAEEKDFI